MSLKVKIQYGIFSGELGGIRLRKELRKVGYIVVKQAKDADIIMAHSAGCFWLPQAPTSQRIMLIDPPYWPGKTLRERVRSRSHNNWRFRHFGYTYRRWLVRNLQGIYYAVRDIRRTLRIFSLAATFDLAHELTGHTILLVRNEHDDWLTPDFETLQKTHPQLTTAILPGDHDDITHHPARYVNLLQSWIDQEGVYERN